MRRTLIVTITFVLLLSACDSQAPRSDAALDESHVELNLSHQSPLAKKAGTPAGGDRTAAVQAYIAEVNADLAARGLGIAVQMAEWVGGGGRHEAGQTVFANDRELRLPSQWVPGDPIRKADGNNITYVVDRSFAMANVANSFSLLDAEAAIDAAFDTWDDVNCSKLDIVKKPDISGVNYSVLLDTGERTDIFYADISTVGFLPGALFDAALGPGASASVLGVTFTFIWIDENGDPTDMNGDGYADTALREIWYNDAFGWSTNGSSAPDVIDIETVALHENGHALGLGHFGKVSITNSNNKLHVSPRAVMNAFILGSLREPLGTDNGAFCSLYASWPN